MWAELKAWMWDVGKTAPSRPRRHLCECPAGVLQGNCNQPGCRGWKCWSELGRRSSGSWCVWHLCPFPFCPAGDLHSPYKGFPVRGPDAGGAHTKVLVTFTWLYYFFFKKTMSAFVCLLILDMINTTFHDI